MRLELTHKFCGGARKVIPSVCQMFARVYINPTPASGSLERSGDPGAFLF